MMPSASPKQRVLIVGAKFGEMYLNAFMQPPEGLELVGPRYFGIDTDYIPLEERSKGGVSNV